MWLLMCWPWRCCSLSSSSFLLKRRESWDGVHVNKKTGPFVFARAEQMLSCRLLRSAQPTHTRAFLKTQRSHFTALRFLFYITGEYITEIISSCFPFWASSSPYSPAQLSQTFSTCFLFHLLHPRTHTRIFNTHMVRCWHHQTSSSPWQLTDTHQAANLTFPLI